MYSPFGRHLGVMAKFGPWASRHSWASVSMMLDRFLSHVAAVIVFFYVALFAGLLSGHNLSLSSHLSFVDTIFHIWIFGIVRSSFV